MNKTIIGLTLALVLLSIGVSAATTCSTFKWTEMYKEGRYVGWISMYNGNTMFSSMPSLVPGTSYTLVSGLNQNHVHCIYKQTASIFGDIYGTYAYNYCPLVTNDAAENLYLVKTSQVNCGSEKFTGNATLKSATTV